MGRRWKGTECIADSALSGTRRQRHEPQEKHPETIRDFNDATADLEADKDENGNPVSGSKKEKVVEAMNKLPLSRKQKNLLYLSRGYSEKN